MPNFKTNRVVVLSIWAEDVPKTAHFYMDVLGLELFEHHHGDRPHLKVEDTYLTILKGKPIPAQDPHPERFPLFALGVDDLDAAVDQLKAYNVELPWGVEEKNGSRWVMFHDPAGNLIELT